MKTTDVKSPTFRIISDQNVHAVENKTRNLFLEGWHPVGNIGRRGNDWVQVMVKESCICPHDGLRITSYMYECPIHGGSSIQVPPVEHDDSGPKMAKEKR